MDIENLTQDMSTWWSRIQSAGSFTSLSGYIDITYAELVDLLGEPNPGDQYKTSAEGALFIDGHPVTDHQLFSFRVRTMSAPATTTCVPSDDVATAKA